MRKKTRKWPRITAMVLVAVVLFGSVALVLVEKFAPDQEYIPKSIVRLPSRVAAAVMQPLQSAFSWVTQGVSEYLQSWKMRKNLEIAYNELKAQNDELIYASLRAAELEVELETLKSYWKITQEKIEMNPIPANVVDKEVGNWFQMFTIDVGEEHGVEENMAVINEKGLIGYTYKVYKTSTEVVSIIDSRASVSGIIQSSRDQGAVRGTLGIEEEATCRMYYLPVDLIPRPGDLVVTSGLGAPFPKGLEIGVVRESTRYMDENKHYVVIEPKVDFMHIEKVLVLVYKASEERVPESNDGQISAVQVPLDTPRPIPSIGDSIADPGLGGVTQPPRPTRTGAPVMNLTSPDPNATADPNATPDPDATPTPNPELDEELAREQALEGED